MLVVTDITIFMFRRFRCSILYSQLTTIAFNQEAAISAVISGRRTGN
jgi:hypothetical protein